MDLFLDLNAWVLPQFLENRGHEINHQLLSFGVR
jgi:hypothetical protein